MDQYDAASLLPPSIFCPFRSIQRPVKPS